MTKKNALSTLGGICMAALLGCEVSTAVRLGPGPSFSFDGSGRLASFSVYGPQTGHKIATPNDAKSRVWSISASSGYPDSQWVTHMTLVYGSVPKGYTQIVPSDATASVLTSGLVYYFSAETTGAPGKDGFFYMDKRVPIPIVVPGLCESAFVGDVKPVKCGTGEAFVEPGDLESFVHENRLR